MQQEQGNTLCGAASAYCEQVVVDKPLLARREPRDVVAQTWVVAKQVPQAALRKCVQRDFSYGVYAIHRAICKLLL